MFLLHLSNEIIGRFPKFLDSIYFKSIYFFTSKGGLGVNFFFVLSGFLITYLILNEKKTSGQFHLGFFLIRRTLRIWPLYVIIGLIGFVVFPLILSDFSTTHEPFYYFIFFANFDEIWNGANDSINFLTAPWSVAVEEQFYLFWGVLLFLLFKLKSFSFPLIIGLLYLLSFFFSVFYWTDEQVMAHHTLAVCQDILMGAFVGWSVFKGKQWVFQLQAIKKWKVLLIYAIGIGFCLLKNKIFSDQLILVERFTLSFFFAFILIDQIGGQHSIFKLGKIKGFDNLGKISYGIYMYHLVIMYLVLLIIPFESWPSAASITAFILSSVILTYLTAALSYRFIESKFLSLKPHNNKS